MANRDGEVYATLLLSDTYLPGALVLGHSLLDNGTTKKLAVLVTEDAVSREAIAQLETVYHHVIPVPRIQSAHPNLELMNRVDLHSAFTKITLWNQTQFSKIVYIDADVVARRAPDELFDIDAPFSAAPDIGWPDIFNTGVMVLTPDAAEYESLRAKAEDGVSFDGADQGLLNMHFGTNYNRISFTYNVTPSAHYQYIPAYKYFQDSINMVHFIGPQKPWFQGRPEPGPNSTSNTNGGQEVSPHDKMIKTWWNVYDKHYGHDKQDNHPPASHEDAKLIQYLVKGEFNPFAAASQDGSSHHEQHQNAVNQEHHHEPDHTRPHDTEESHPPPPPRAAEPVPPPAPQSHQPHHDQPTDSSEQSEPHHDRPTDSGGHAEHHVERVERPPPPPMEPVWDASRQPPTTFSRPEAPHFPDTKYEMSLDSAPFVPPERYPSPPKNMWYDIPPERPEPAQRPKPIFPWESHQAPPTRVFAPDYVTPPLKKPEVRLEPAIKREASPPRADGEPAEPSSPASSTRSVRFREEDEEIDIPPAGSPLLGPDEEGTSPSDSPVSPISPEPLEEPPVSAPEFWNSSTAANAWDDVPGIRRYIERVIDQTGLGGRRRRDVLRSRMMPDGGAMHIVESPPPTRQPRRGFFKITDFPSAVDRPSLPVTPALPGTPGDRRRDARYGEAEGEEGETSPPPRPGPLVEAEGVPRQSEWNPVERLARLAADPAALLKRLSADSGGVPEREVVGSSEGLSGRGRGGAEGGVKGGAEGGEKGAGEMRRVERERGAQEKGETPLVAPIPLKRRPADPVGDLEAASSIGPGNATYSEVVRHTDAEDGQPEGEEVGQRVVEGGRTEVEGDEETEVEGMGRTDARRDGEEVKGAAQDEAKTGRSEVEAGQSEMRAGQMKAGGDTPRV